MELGEEYEKKARNFFDGDGKLKQYPRKRPVRLAALAMIAESFAAEREYTEKEVNGIIGGRIAFSDIELVRRELYEEHFLDRLRDGSKYWKR